VIELKEKSKLIINTDKVFYRSFLKNIFRIPFEIKFWDGEEEKYGEGDSKFKLIFNCPLSRTKLLNDPSLALGEAYMTNEIDIDGDLQNIIEYLYQNKKSILHNNSNKHIRNNLKNSKDNVHYHYDI